MNKHLIDDDPRDLVSLFERALRRDPDHVAVSDDERALTFAELGLLSDRLASKLSARGVARGDGVAICIRRGVDVLVAMLGILKIGAAYVAIDRRLPIQRCNLMVRNSGSRLVLTDGTGTDLSVREDVSLLGWNSASDPPSVPPQRPPITGADLACVMFTSGSSGTPKAIMVEHRSLVALARNASLPAIEPDDRFGQVASLSFDTFHIETWCALDAGAEVVVLPTMPELINGDVHRELRRRRVSVLLAPTMAVNHVVHEDREAFSSLRILQTGGDVLQPSACAALFSGGFKGELWNLYGPTETTTASTCHQVTVVDSVAASVPIGRDLHGEQVLVVDPDLNQVAVGGVGELCIGGDGVTRGYLGAPAQTAERFLPHPGGDFGGRMYRTGDRVRRRPDGVIEFLGRVDEQVKIRGYRVEPREAEHVIGQHPAVRDAAVIVVGDAHDKRLVALVVMADDTPPSQLRSDVGRSLPDYLVPSAFLAVPEIPGTDHGKRDLDRLRTMAEAQVRRQSRRVEPRDEIEVYLVRLWEQILRVEWISRTDDFFALGGNSLLAFRSRRRIARDLGVAVEVPEIMEARELGQLAAMIRARRSTSAKPQPDPTAQPVVAR